MSQAPRVPTWALILLVSVCWGSNFVAMKLALRDWEPFTLSAMRNAVGALVLLGYALLNGQSPPRGRQWRTIFWVSLNLTTISSACFTFGLQYISASLASVLVNTMPFFMVLLARPFLGEKPSRRGLAGLALGFVGAALIAAPSGGDAAQPLGVVFVLLAAATWASGSIIVKRTGLSGPDAPYFVSIQLFMSFAALALLAAWQDGLGAYAVPGRAIGPLLFASIPGLALPFLVWSEILRRGSALRASSTAYLVPLFGVLSAVIVLGDRFQAMELAGGALILTGVAIINSPVPARRPR